MSILKNLLAGVAGAVALNLLHEGLKHKGEGMPRVDLLGEEAVQKSAHYFGTSVDASKLYQTTLAGDLISNSLYYSLIGMGGPNQVWTRATFYGLAAGLGAIALPKPLGLDPLPVTKSGKAKAFTILYYLVGALTTGGVVTAMNKK